MTMMDYRYIEQLLQRYFDCETTPQEETILRTFFSQEEIPQELKAYCNLFEAQRQLAGMRLSDGFEERIMRRVEGDAVRPRRITMVRRFAPIYKAAAGVAIVLSLGLAAQQGLGTAHDATVTPRATRPAGEQVSVLPQAQPAAMGDTLLVTPSK